MNILRTLFALDTPAARAVRDGTLSELANDPRVTPLTVDRRPMHERTLAVDARPVRVPR